MGCGSDLDVMGVVLKVEVLMVCGDVVVVEEYLIWVLFYVECYDVWYDFLVVGFIVQQCVLWLKGDIIVVYEVMDCVCVVVCCWGFD